MPVDLEALFEKHEVEYLEFKRVDEPLHKRPDLCAFLLLDKLIPGDRDIVSGAGHEEIWLDIDLEKLAESATEADIVTLIRCGIRLDDDSQSLAMFV